MSLVSLILYTDICYLEIFMEDEFIHCIFIRILRPILFEILRRKRIIHYSCRLFHSILYYSTNSLILRHDTFCQALRILTFWRTPAYIETVEYKNVLICSNVNIWFNLSYHTQKTQYLTEYLPFAFIMMSLLFFLTYKLVLSLYHFWHHPVSFFAVRRSSKYIHVCNIHLY